MSRLPSLSVLSVLVPSLALASGYALPNVNPRDLGLSASAVAAQRGAGAVFGNPAALARLDGLALQLGGTVVDLRNTWSDPTGAVGDTSMRYQFVPVPSVFAAWGGRAAVPTLGERGWGVGLGLTTFGGGAVKWPSDWAGRYRIVEVDRRVVTGLLTAGLELLPGVRLGGGLVYYYTTQELSQKVSLAAFAPGLPDATGTVDTSGGALSYDLSAEVDLPRLPVTLGLDYKHKGLQETTGDVRWRGVPPPVAAAPQGALLRNQDAHEDLTVPNVLNVGAAWRATPPLLVTFGYTFDRWVVYQADVFVGSRQPEGVTPELRVGRDYRNGHVLRLGAEYDLLPVLQVRAGLQRDLSGLRTAAYSPSLPDASSWAGALGASLKVGRGFSVDAALFYAWMDRVTATSVGVEPPAAPIPVGTFRGRYDISAFLYGVALGWTPGGA